MKDDLYTDWMRDPIKWILGTVCGLVIALGIALLVVCNEVVKVMR